MQRYAGNPTSRKELGITSVYTFNNLNQFTSGSWTGALTVIGEVNYAAGTVTVNSVTAKLFPDRIFEATNITVSAGTNTLTAVYHGPAFTNTQTVATNTSTVIMATPVFGYDAKGNLTNDAEFVYQYDIGNRLTNVISKASGTSVLAARYDGLGRRIEVTRNASTVERYVYFPGSFLVLAVLDGSNQIKEIYTHGPDLSGVVGGAGGIGGILAVRYPQQTNAPTYFVHGDAMGNIILATDQQGKEIGHYRYSPFGRPLNQSGTFTPRFQYSSKEHDPESALLNFGYRHLNPQIGRWMERDRITERGGPNLYRALANSTPRVVDILGLADAEGSVSGPTPWRLGWEWLTGTGPEHRDFGWNDQMTQDLRRGPQIQSALKAAQTELREKCKGYRADSSYGPYPVQAQGDAGNDLSGPSGPLKYIRDYSVIVTGERFGGNLTVTFLGSFNGDWQAIGDCCSRNARICFTIKNSSSLASGTRFPITGYWSDDYTATIWEMVTFKDFGIPSGIFPSRPPGATGPGRTTSQSFKWCEDISF